tara:strand:+ start:95 stop:904 length:810 start_codon:yes stop_codon:yes gene_type:complete
MTTINKDDDDNMMKEKHFEASKEAILVLIKTFVTTCMKICPNHTMNGIQPCFDLVNNAKDADGLNAGIKAIRAQETLIRDMVVSGTAFSLNEEMLEVMLKKSLIMYIPEEVTIKALDEVMWPQIIPDGIGDHRANKGVDIATERVISDIIARRGEMAKLLTNPQAYNTLDEVVKILKEFNELLSLEVKPLSSVNPKNHNIGFSNWAEYFNDNVDVSRLRQFRRANEMEKDTKDKKGGIIQRSKIKWNGKLTSAPIINYTPVARKKGEGK